MTLKRLFYTALFASMLAYFIFVGMGFLFPAISLPNCDEGAGPMISNIVVACFAQNATEGFLKLITIILLGIGVINLECLILNCEKSWSNSFWDRLMWPFRAIVTTWNTPDYNEAPLISLAGILIGLIFALTRITYTVPISFIIIAGMKIGALIFGGLILTAIMSWLFCRINSFQTWKKRFLQPGTDDVAWMLFVAFVAIGATV